MITLILTGEKSLRICGNKKFMATENFVLKAHSFN